MTLFKDLGIEEKIYSGEGKEYEGNDHVVFRLVNKHYIYSAFLDHDFEEVEQS